MTQAAGVTHADIMGIVVKWLCNERISIPTGADVRLIERLSSCLQIPESIAIGSVVRHRLNHSEMLVIDLERGAEGEGHYEWFTGRTKDMQTWRVRRHEVELVEPFNDTGATKKGTGQYL